MKDIELVCFKIISAVGEAKSEYVMAMDEAEKGNYDLAYKHIENGDKCYLNGHQQHASLIQKEASGEKTDVCLLLLHAEDQLMAAETVKLMAEKIIALNRKLEQ